MLHDATLQLSYLELANFLRHCSHSCLQTPALPLSPLCHASDGADAFRRTCKTSCRCSIRLCKHPAAGWFSFLRYAAEASHDGLLFTASNYQLTIKSSELHAHMLLIPARMKLPCLALFRLPGTGGVHTAVGREHGSSQRAQTGLMSSAKPAEVLVGSLLVGGHEIHELQPGALVLRTEQGAAVCVDAAHPLQGLEERLPYLGPLQMHKRRHAQCRGVRRQSPGRRT